MVQLKNENIFIEHWYDTIRVLGGYKGILLLFLIVILFYILVEYLVTSNRNNRLYKKKY